MAKRTIEETSIVTQDGTALVVTANRKSKAVVFRVSAGGATVSFVWCPEDAAAIGLAVSDAAAKAVE